MIDTSKLKKGDVLHIKAVFDKKSGSGNIVLTSKMVYSETLIDINWAIAPTEIVHVEERPLAAGDKVTALNRPISGLTLEIISIDDDVAWCKNGKDRWTLPLASLRRVP